jgi:uncharacterized protein YbjT (DUF2867 family)
MGRILLEKAVEQGHEVTALARNPSAVAPQDYRPRVLRGNVLDPDAVEAAVAGQDAVLSGSRRVARAARSPRPPTPRLDQRGLDRRVRVLQVVLEDGVLGALEPVFSGSQKSAKHP